MKRKAGVGAYYGGGTAAVATVHYLIKCFQGGHFHFVPPEDALVEIWAMLMLPIVAPLYQRAVTWANGEQEN